MKLIILVLSKKDNGNIYDKFYQLQKDTWDSVDVENVSTFFYFGDSSENYIDGEDIFVSTEDSLRNCGLKTIEVFKILKDYHYDFIFRTNSSSYVDKELLYKFLLDKPKLRYYAGKVGNHYNIPFASGSGFVMSKDIVDFLLLNESKINHHFLDDVSFGKILSENDINPKELPRFDVTSDNIDTDYFHYRIKNDNRDNDLDFMKKIFNLKQNRNGINNR